ncbi:TetR/AcrR family transcriptional regulator [Nocardia sp. CA-120079]|uniref:TetR/AcrR family transcriptional regulator n=1 Tax=Nocardia sp. CA-120079 TaxID=3239974 RepID=UPI003D9873B7
MRERILHCAASIIAERGLTGTKLSAIAAMANLQTGSLYYHFADRAALVEEVTRRGVLDSLNAAQKAVETCSAEATSKDRLLAAADAHLGSILESGSLAPAAIAILPQLPPELRQRFQQELGDFRLFWVGLVTAAVADGYLAGEIDVELLALYIVYTLNTVTVWTELRPGEPKETRSAFLALLQHGILRSPERG